MSVTLSVYVLFVPYSVTLGNTSNVLYAMGIIIMVCIASLQRDARLWIKVSQRTLEAVGNIS